MRADRKYKNDYELRDVPRKNGKGTKTIAVYKGAYWKCDLPDEDYKIFMRRMMWMLGGISLLYVVMGVLPSGALGASAAPYVLLPYIALLLPLGMCWGKAVMLAYTKRPLERKEYELWVVQRRSYVMGMLICSIATCVGGLAYIAMHWGAAHIVHDALFTLSSGLICTICQGFVRLHDHCPYVKLGK